MPDRQGFEVDDWPSGQGGQVDDRSRSQGLCALAVILVVVGAATASMWQTIGPRQAESADRSTTLRPPGGAKPLRVLAYNLCWEGMSAWDFGTGKYTARACVPGTLAADEQHEAGYRWEALSEELQAICRQVPWRRSAEEKALVYKERLFDNYMTSCTHRLLQSLRQWHQEAPFDLVAFVEVCSPGADGQHFAGFVPQDGDVELYNKRQCSAGIFDLLPRVFPNHAGVVNSGDSSGPVVSMMVLYDEQKFGAHDVSVLGELEPGRPFTAVFWESRRLLFVGMHNVHARSMARSNGCETQEGVVSWCDFARKNHPEAESFANASDQEWKLAFAELRNRPFADVFSAFLESRIVDGLVEQSALCRSVPSCSELLSHWRIVVAGDFNDAFGELIDLQLFGNRVRLQPQHRQRTCCGDRDEYWLEPYAGTPFGGYAEPLPEPYVHAALVWRKMLGDHGDDCAEVNDTCIATFRRRFPHLLVEGGAPRPDGDVGGPSRYPFPADMVLDTEPMDEGLFFPDGYFQSYEGAISDHDPVVAHLRPLTFHEPNV